MSISTTTSGSISARMINEKRLQLSGRLQKTLKHKSLRKRLVRYGLVAANVALLGGVAAFVLTSSHADHTIKAHAVAGANSSDPAVVKPVDGLTSYDIAANVARMTSLPESAAINNQAQSARVAEAVSASDTNVVAKPQIVATALKSRKDIQQYIVQPGDTATIIAQKFGITSDSIKWSNNLKSDTVTVGAKLTIPPVNGIVYTVASGDTVQSLASKYKASADQIIAYNDAEISGLQVGEQVIIPNGQIQTVTTRSSIFLGAGGSFTAQYGSNGYDYGYCTYYAAARSGAPSNWGNANTWAYYAALTPGWTVSSAPRVGAIAQTSAGYLGHVAIVEAVSADGTQIKYSDMNGISGWGRVGYSDWTPVGHFQHYIYRS